MKNKKNKKNKLKIGLLGGSGRMGQEVQAVLQTLSHEPFLFVGHKKEAQILFSMSIPNLNNVENEILQDVDVWIDFSSPAGFFELLKSTSKTPIVSGTTGFTASELTQMNKEAQKRPLFWSSNMSVGLWTFRQALKSFSALTQFDFALDEIHHTQKKDSPSGTALTLHQDLEKITNKKIPTPTAHRIGGIFGIHTVHAASANEIISFKHEALNRKVFATGAAQAAEWIVKQKKGLYTMDDMLLKKRSLK